MLSCLFFIIQYFKHNFNVLNLIADEFDIDLPSLPKRKDYEGRFDYYGKICKVLHNFRIKNNMSTYELCAFLYDFAPKYIGAGYGKQAMDWIKKEIKNRGYDKICLWVLEENNRARRFYEKSGFVCDGKIKSSGLADTQEVRYICKYNN